MKTNKVENYAVLNSGDKFVERNVKCFLQSSFPNYLGVAKSGGWEVMTYLDSDLSPTPQLY